MLLTSFMPALKLAVYAGCRQLVVFPVTRGGVVHLRLLQSVSYVKSLHHCGPISQVKDVVNSFDNVFDLAGWAAMVWRKSRTLCSSLRCGAGSTRTDNTQAVDTKQDMLSRHHP